jgi:hypothetical protein
MQAALCLFVTEQQAVQVSVLLFPAFALAERLATAR